MTRLAVISLHSSPLLQPGVGDSGGMNVYVRELAASLAQSGVDTTVYVRRWHGSLPAEVNVEPGFRVVHVTGGPAGLVKEHLPEAVEEFTEGVLADLAARPADVLHANYWLSGAAGHRLKHELDLPLVTTFHTLARVKAETGDPEPDRRVRAEAEIIGCSDVIIANSIEESSQLRRLYGADPDRIEVVPPGVDHAFFSPGDRVGARRALGLDPGAPTLLFVGRIQPLKGLDVAIGALAELVGGDQPAARLVVVGGPSGVEGPAEVSRVRSLAASLGVADRICWIDPQPTTCCPRGIGRLMWWWCRAARSPSAWWRWRPPRAGSRSSRPRSVGSGR